MHQPIADLIRRQQLRVDSLARAAGRFFDDDVAGAFRRVSAKLGQLPGMLASPNDNGRGPRRDRLEGQLERLVRDVQQLRLDEPASVARVAWVLAEIEESLRPVAGPMMPVYSAGTAK